MLNFRFYLLNGFLICLLAGCAFSRPLSIDAGLYTLNRNFRQMEGSAPPIVERIQVDREKEELTIFLRKGSPLLIPYSSRPKLEWPAGCPGNLFSQKMEVFELEVDQSSRAMLGMKQPILVRNCPETPYQLVLREQGEIGGSSNACPFPETCLIFQSASDEKESSCPELEILVEELNREVSVLEEQVDQLVDGYGPGIWYFRPSGVPNFHHSLDDESLEGTARELNQLLANDDLPTIQVKYQNDQIVQVEVSHDLQLTQGMGSSGAQEYLQVVLYTLTSLPGIDCVDFQFMEGDHARPGIVCRE